MIRTISDYFMISPDTLFTLITTFTVLSFQFVYQNTNRIYNRYITRKNNINFAIESLRLILIPSRKQLIKLEQFIEDVKNEEKESVILNVHEFPISEVFKELEMKDYYKICKPYFLATRTKIELCNNIISTTAYIGNFNMNFSNAFNEFITKFESHQEKYFNHLNNLKVLIHEVRTKTTNDQISFNFYNEVAKSILSAPEYNKCIMNHQKYYVVQIDNIIQRYPTLQDYEKIQAEIYQCFKTYSFLKEFRKRHSEFFEIHLNEFKSSLEKADKYTSQLAENNRILPYVFIWGNKS